MDIRHILARKGTAVHTISPRASVAEAVARMCETGISALVVSEDDATISGIISDRGIIRAIAGSGTDVMRDKVSSVMTADVITCTPADSIESVMQTMTERRIRHIPVTDDNGLLNGLISIGDAVKNRLDELGEQTEAMREYITGTH